jgi:hypothetical protein
VGLSEPEVPRPMRRTGQARLVGVDRPDLAERTSFALLPDIALCRRPGDVVGGILRGCEARLVKDHDGVSPDGEDSLDRQHFTASPGEKAPLVEREAYQPARFWL